MASCDLFIMIGTDFPYLDFYPDKAKCIQVDIDPRQIGKRKAVDVGLAGYAQTVLTELNKHVEPKHDDSFLKSMQADMKKWWEKMAEKERAAEPLHPQTVSAAVSEIAQPDAIFCCDTGNVTVWNARHLKIREGQRFTVSGGMASMGYGLPAAIGAQLTFPDRQVFALCGDGGFTMLMGDFVTAVQYALPIVVVVFNNGKLGMIQMEQEEMGYPDYGIQLLNPDFAMFARACGGMGETIKDINQLHDALERATTAKMPYILDVFVNPDELTIPPRIEFEQATGFVKAKIKEFFGAGDSEGGFEEFHGMRLR
jgi:thiamine pyrophosphate-dependent acetolactate synthase large subunit-like protein